MSDHRPFQDGVSADAGRGEADQPGAAASTTQAEIDDVMNDPDLPMEERQARLQELAERLGIRDDTQGDEGLTPLEAQIGEALAMLAQGGHAYRNTDAAAFENSEGSVADFRSASDDPDRDL